MTSSPAAKASGKSPLLAALISIPMPGVGHMYAGAITRGLVILLASWLAVPAAASALGPPGLIVVVLFLAWVSRDAWTTAERESAEEERALAAGAPPRAWVAWAWAAARAAWILPVPALGGAALAVSSVLLLFHGRAEALGTALLAAPLLLLAWLAASHTGEVLNGERAMAESAMKDEIGATLLVGGVAGVLFLIAAPAYRGLFRRSAEGAMKGNLVALRQAVERYRGAHAGRAPESLDALASDKALGGIPSLWPSGSGVPHERTSASIVVGAVAGADSGRWAYVVSASSPEATGTIYIDCTHTDTRGGAWTSY
jgi:Tfp pilus assembly protein PilE/TM2 domain-containing membrane protein YozV